MVEIERILIILADNSPAWLVAALLTLTSATSFMRYRVWRRDERIREYPRSPLGVGLVLFCMALFYWYIESVTVDIRARAAAVRILLSLFSVAEIAFNWGAIRAYRRHVAERIGRIVHARGK